MKKTRLIGALAAACALIPAGNALAATQTVSESSIARQSEDAVPTKSWVLYTRPAAPGAGSFVTGPAAPALGFGSLELTTVSGSDKVFLFNFDHVGTRLADVDDIAYSTYRSIGADQQVAALNLQIDFNGPATDGGFSTLVFEPVYNTTQGAVVSNEWQHWSADGSAIWWSTKPIPGVCAFTCYVSWDDIVAANPAATVLGGVGVNQGSGNPTLTTAVDAFTFDDTTYDFERTPGSKDECKKDGWSSFGGLFTNQGDCVSSVATGGKKKK